MDKIRVLIIGDNLAKINEIKEIFDTETHIIHIAKSGKEGLNTLLTKIIDVVIMELVMTELSGCETAKLIRTNNRISHVPILIVTDELESEMITKQMLICGAFDVFYKPFSKDILLHKVKLFYELFMTRKELENQVKVLTKLNEQNLEMRKQIEQIASIDYLTEVANRRMLDKVLSDIYIEALQNKTPVTLLMIDLDNFKMYNDYFGHQKGDRALRQIARSSKKIVNKSNGILGRYGGEEFLAVIGNTDVNDAEKISANIVKTIQELNIKHSPVCDKDILTISVGVVSLVPTSRTSVGKLISFADEALYDAKSKGKNQYFIKKI